MKNTWRERHEAKVRRHRAKVRARVEARMKRSRKRREREAAVRLALQAARIRVVRLQAELRIMGIRSGHYETTED